MTTRIYTKTGDRGETGLWGGARVQKDHPRIAAVGEIDELCATLGQARSHFVADDARIDAMCRELQNLAFDLGAAVAAPGVPPPGNVTLDDGTVRNLEAHIDAIEATLPPLKNFILPGGHPAAAALHVARAVCRRAERALIPLWRETPDPLRLPLQILNRVSDLLFVLARHCNALHSVPDVLWEPRRG